jgi:hypothetical protein
VRIGDSRTEKPTNARQTPPERPRPPVLPYEYDQDDEEAACEALLQRHRRLGHNAFIEATRFRVVCRTCNTSA